MKCSRCNKDFPYLETWVHESQSFDGGNLEEKPVGKLCRKCR